MRGKARCVVQKELSTRWHLTGMHGMKCIVCNRFEYTYNIGCLNWQFLVWNGANILHNVMYGMTELTVGWYVEIYAIHTSVMYDWPYLLHLLFNVNLLNAQIDGRLYGKYTSQSVFSLTAPNFKQRCRASSLARHKTAVLLSSTSRQQTIPASHQKPLLCSPDTDLLMRRSGQNKCICK